MADQPDQTPPTLRARMARAIHRYDHHHGLSGNDIPGEHQYGEADAILAEVFGPAPDGMRLADWTAVRAIQLMAEAGRERDAAKAQLEETASRAAAAISAMGADVRAANRETARLRTAWQSAVAGRREARAALDRVRALHRKANNGDTCVYCAHGQRLGYDTTWPCDTIRAPDGTEATCPTPLTHNWGCGCPTDQYRPDPRPGPAPAEVPVHACPGPDDNGISPCCRRPPFEFRGERITRDPDKVTCPGVGATEATEETK